jgi:Ni,Fe-hydrogenase III small subunit
MVVLVVAAAVSLAAQQRMGKTQNRLPSPRQVVRVGEL